MVKRGMLVSLGLMAHLVNQEDQVNLDQKVTLVLRVHPETMELPGQRGRQDQLEGQVPMALVVTQEILDSQDHVENLVMWGFPDRMGSWASKDDKDSRDRKGNLGKRWARARTRLRNTVGTVLVN